MEQNSELSNEVLPLLRTLSFGRSLRGYDRISSTNAVALRWAGEGAPHGSVVLSEFQTAGRGRLGRSWFADPGKNLTFSVILRPSLPVQKLGLITIASCVGAVNTISEYIKPASPVIKWPNDILIENRKICGMLLESILDLSPHAHASAVILGVGLNVNQDHFGSEVFLPATSLLLESGRIVPRAPLLATLLFNLELFYMRLQEGDDTFIRSEYTRQLKGISEPVKVQLTESGAYLEGILLGIAEDGALRLRTESGISCFYAGDITMHLPD